MAEEKIIATGHIGNALRSSAADHVTTFSDEIFDTERQQYQSEVNTELEATDNEIKEELEAETTRAAAAEEANAQAITGNKTRLDDGIDLYPSLTLAQKYVYLKLENGNVVVASGGNQDWGYTDFIDVTGIDKLYYNIYSLYKDTVIIAAYDSAGNFIESNSVVVGDTDSVGLYSEGVWQKASDTSKIKISTKANNPEAHIGTGQLLSIEKMREAINEYGEINKNIVCFGDSLTEGTGSTTGKPATETNTDLSYPAVLKRLINDGRDVVNAGAGGESSWMVAYRQGAETLTVEPFTIPSSGKARVYIKGQEDDFFYNNGWTFSEGNLSHNISLSGNSQVNPCKIAGIEGILSRVLISEGESDPTTGETVQQNTYAWYFTRNTAGDSLDITRPMQVVTKAYDKLRGHIQVIWCGQNDAPSHDGAYILQPYDYKRTKLMVDNLTTDRYIVMNHPLGSDESKARDDQEWNQLFGAHYINIRKYISKYGVGIANSLGAGIEISDSDKTLIEKGTIPTCLRIDGVHGNYWYYQIVARAVYDKGKSLGYW